MTFRFKNFPIYNEIRLLIKDVYKITATFPKSEQFELGSQLRRATTSILLNLAEGSMRSSDKELNRFMLISIGSIAEVVSILDICLDLNYISSSTHEKYVLEFELLSKKFYGFRKKLSL